MDRVMQRVGPMMRGSPADGIWAPEGRKENRKG